MNIWESTEALCDLTDEQYAAIWEQFDLGGVSDTEIRAFADVVYRYGQYVGMNDYIMPVPERSGYYRPCHTGDFPHDCSYCGQPESEHGSGPHTGRLCPHIAVSPSSDA